MPSKWRSLSAQSPTHSPRRFSAGVVQTNVYATPVAAVVFALAVAIALPERFPVAVGRIAFGSAIFPGKTACETCVSAIHPQEIRSSRHFRNKSASSFPKPLLLPCALACFTVGIRAKRDRSDVVLSPMVQHRVGIAALVGDRGLCLPIAQQQEGLGQPCVWPPVK